MFVFALVWFAFFLSSFGIILKRKRELVALLLVLPYGRLVTVYAL